ncbi:MAG: hypothetical protein HQK96_18735 [Nitrospirae bacterium]|nr:hypothetical protein [Nitrospirota bacterium]
MELIKVFIKIVIWFVIADLVLHAADIVITSVDVALSDVKKLRKKRRKNTCLK